MCKESGVLNFGGTTHCFVIPPKPKMCQESVILNFGIITSYFLHFGTMSKNNLFSVL